MKNFDKLEVGRTYLNGLGKEVEIKLLNIHEPTPYKYADADGGTYTEDGYYMVSQKSDWDLITLLSLKEIKTKPNNAIKKIAIEAAKRAVDPIVAVGLLTEDEGNELFDSLVDTIEDMLIK